MGGVGSGRKVILTNEQRKRNHAARKQVWRVRNSDRNKEIAKNGRLRAKEKLIDETIRRVKVKYFDEGKVFEDEKIPRKGYYRTQEYRDKNRIYYANKWANDPEFREYKRKLNREYYLKKCSYSKEERSEYNKEYYQQNKGDILKDKKIRLSKNLAKRKYTDVDKATKKRYRLKNRLKINKYQLAYYHKKKLKTPEEGPR